MIEISTDEFENKTFTVILNDIFQFTDELPRSTLMTPNTSILNRAYQKDTRESSSNNLKNICELEDNVKDECALIDISDSKECVAIEIDNSESEEHIKLEVSDSEYNSEEFHTMCDIESDIWKHNYHECPLCGICYYTQNALILHSKRAHRSVEGHKRYAPRKYSCKICQKKYGNVKEARYCRDNHSKKNVNRYECRICQQSFSKKLYMQTHERRHTGEKPYKCTFCPKDFRQLSNLNQHVVRWHTEEKPYKCSYCPKDFRQLSNLNQHVRRHTQEKPYKCTVCPENFRQLSNLNQHIMNQHTSDKKDLFDCIICYKQFKTEELLREHDFSHKDEKYYLCYICAKQFTYEWSLQAHIESQHKTNFSS